MHDVSLIAGIIFLEGEAWKVQRRFTLRNLRNVGFAKQDSMEVVIQEELKELLENLKSTMGDGRQTVLHMHNYFNLSVINVLWSMITGVRYAHHDPTIHRLLDLVNFLFKYTTIGGLSDVYPSLRIYAPKLTGEYYQVQAYKDLQNFIRVGEIKVL